ncbi:processive diacylglycerol beta-glucosyltransferase [mine drainage metagenome]|uniref:Processive diacylglycerol beta-glucosyltransferase n=1 Tax=mine drainage metagenome TaxID=410659 RepID=A0A1J5S0P9_9ZZZZ
MRKILILTAGFGEGHNAAARNIAAAIDAEAGPGTAHSADLFALASPRLNRISRAAYLSMINRTPRLWSAVYAWIDRAAPFPRHLWFLRKERAVLERLLAGLDPAAVCATYPVYAFIADRLRATGRLRVPFFNVVTDSISINSLWTRPACDGWYVPNPETGAVIAAQGVPEERIHDLGFPVQPAFERLGGELSPPDLASGARPRVLQIVHSGVLNAEPTARRLIDETDWELTFAVGRDEALRDRLLRATRNRPHPAAVLSWTDQIPRLLLTHHCVISKAGGATTQEAIAARCPMIVTQIVPGQEEGNYELLRRRGVGALATTPDAVLASLRQAFHGHGWIWNRWRESLTTLARPAAARLIARHALDAGAPAGAPAAQATPVAPLS